MQLVRVQNDNNNKQIKVERGEIGREATDAHGVLFASARCAHSTVSTVAAAAAAPPSSSFALVLTEAASTGRRTQYSSLRRRRCKRSVERENDNDDPPTHSTAQHFLMA